MLEPGGFDVLIIDDSSADVVMSNRMRQAMEGNNGDGKESWILDAIDKHSTLVWTRSMGNVEVRVYKIENTGGS